MDTLEIENGRWSVIATRNAGGARWDARLYVNHGKTATLTSSRFKTEAGLRRWAIQQFKRMGTNTNLEFKSNEQG